METGRSVIAQLTSLANVGLSCERVTVEVGSTPGEFKFFIVGLGDTAVQESKQRVIHALRSSGLRISMAKVVTVNLAPADVRKIGPRFDLPIALGLLISQDLVDLPDAELQGMAFLGELALDGSLRHITGVLSAAIACKERGIRTLVVPHVDGPEAASIPGVTIIAPASLQELLGILQGELKPTPVHPPPIETLTQTELTDFADVRGQQHAKRALEIAAAGGHNVLLNGVPGAGKTLLARAFRGILPPMTFDETIEVTRIYSVANLLPRSSPLISRRPFRMVHHTASAVSIVGGGQVPGPGEISLAHRGVLFLDEIAEFPPQVLEVLRQPLEDRCITVTRTQGSVTFPADFTLIAAMNPPRYAPNPRRAARRISAPLLDRIDLHVDVRPVPIEDLERSPKPGAECSTAIRQRVIAARERQAKRFAGTTVRTNTEMRVRQIDRFCPLEATSLQLLRQATARLGLSARGYHRTIKVARTIADLEGNESIEARHVAEALQYRHIPDNEQ